jgi:hypothetical protein
VFLNYYGSLLTESKRVELQKEVRWGGGCSLLLRMRRRGAYCAGTPAL